MWHAYAGDNQREEHVLAVGAGGMALVSAEGELLGETAFEEPPVGRAVIGDVDGDGINDVVIVTARAYYGYRLLARAPSMLFPSLIVALLVAMAALAIYHRSQSASEPSHSSRRRR